MKYALLIYDQEQYWTDMDQSERERVMAGYTAFTEEIQNKKVMVGAEALQPVRTAKTWRKREGKLLKTDGPFAETKELLAGFYLLDCESLDEALEYAAKIPAAKFGTIEVRPAIDLEDFR